MATKRMKPPKGKTKEVVDYITKQFQQDPRWTFHPSLFTLSGFRANTAPAIRYLRNMGVIEEAYRNTDNQPVWGLAKVLKNTQRLKKTKSNPKVEGGLEYSIRPTHIDLIRAGDTVLRDGKLKTVSRNNIKKDNFMGRTLWGDSYNSGHKPVLLAEIVHAKPKYNAHKGSTVSTKKNPKKIPFSVDRPREGMPSWRHGGVRITYSPSWSKSKPWALYINGTASNIFQTFDGARRAAGVMHVSILEGLGRNNTGTKNRKFYVWKDHPAYGTVFRNNKGTWVPWSWFQERTDLKPKVYTLAGAKRESTRLINSGESKETGWMDDHRFEQYKMGGWFDHAQRVRKGKLKTNPNLPEFRIKTSSGYSYVTAMSPSTTLKKAKDYFLGKYINIGSAGKDKMEKVTSVTQVDGSYGIDPTAETHRPGAATTQVLRPVRPRKGPLVRNPIPEWATASLQTINGSKGMFMLGAKNATYDTKNHTVSMRIGKNQSGANVLRIQYNPGKDLYDVSLRSVRMSKGRVSDKVKAELIDAYGDMIYSWVEHQTGMYLSMGRQRNPSMKKR